MTHYVQRHQFRCVKKAIDAQTSPPPGEAQDPTLELVTMLAPEVEAPDSRLFFSEASDPETAQLQKGAKQNG